MTPSTLTHQFLPSSQNPVAPTDLLPREMWGHIFTFLDMSALNQVICVNKCFRDLILPPTRYKVPSKTDRPSKILDSGYDRIKTVFYQRGLLFAGAEDGKILLCQKQEKGDRWYRSYLEGHTFSVNTVVFSDHQLFSGSSDHTIKVWEKQKRAWSCVQTLEGHSHMVSSLFVKDSLLFSGSLDRNIKVWEKQSESWSCIQTLAVNGSVNCVFYEEGQLFSGDINNTLKVWEVQNGRWKSIQDLRDHGGSVNSLFAKGNLLFSGSSDQTVKIWKKEIAGWDAIYTLPGYSDSINTVFFKESLLFIGLSNGTIDIRDQNNEWDSIYTFSSRYSEGVSSLFCAIEPLPDSIPIGFQHLLFIGSEPRNAPAFNTGENLRLLKF